MRDPVGCMRVERGGGGGGGGGVSRGRSVKVGKGRMTSLLSAGGVIIGTQGKMGVSGHESFCQLNLIALIRACLLA